MKNIVLLLLTMVFAVACSKSGITYYCQCTITNTVGSGTYVGPNGLTARAEADCSDKMVEVTAGGQSANCDVVESVD
jgi:hypothetical protein